jgi:hypothetical protein
MAENRGFRRGGGGPKTVLKVKDGRAGLSVGHERNRNFAAVDNFRGKNQQAICMADVVCRRVLQHYIL